MKKVVVASVLAVATGTAFYLPAAMALEDEQSQGAQSSQITIKDPAEYNAYTNAIGQSSPAAKASAIEQFLTQYPNSVVKEDMLQQLMAAYEQAGQADKELDAANRLLQVNPNNIRAHSGRGSLLAGGDRAQGQPRRHPDQLQSHPRLPRRNGG